MKLARVLAIAVVGVGLVGCNEVGPKQGIGTVAGAVAGGVIGHQFGGGTGKAVATAAGAVIGGLIGSEIGKALDDADRRAAYEAEMRALEFNRSGTPVNWRNPDSGNYGEVVPGPAYRINSRQCRDYTHTVYIAGRPEVVRGTACRTPDGTWRQIS
ncbi:MAG: hypothetical protein C0606_00575 [Hyphomicrobiales bacterium]|nr:MAG: hypothetical protein C0606_00575 [Hyphomicrobiales bacterium]